MTQYFLYNHYNRRFDEWAHICLLLIWSLRNHNFEFVDVLVSRLLLPFPKTSSENWQHLIFDQKTEVPEFLLCQAAEDAHTGCNNTTERLRVCSLLFSSLWKQLTHSRLLILRRAAITNSFCLLDVQYRSMLSAQWRLLLEKLLIEASNASCGVN